MTIESKPYRVGLVMAALSLAMMIVPFAPTRADALWCTLNKPDNPWVAGSGELVSSTSATCDESVYKRLENSIRKLNSFWPDTVIAVSRQYATTTYWAVTAAGCEHPNSSHSYKAKAKFTGLSDKDSSTVTRTCTA